MRVLAFIVAVLSLSSVAYADDDDEDDAFVAMPKHSWGMTVVGHGSRVAGRSEDGIGPALEFAIGRDRWQYVGEAMLATTAVQLDPSPDVARAQGKLVHGAVGVRWLARQFRPARGAGVEMFLQSMVGAQRFYLANGGRLARPELALGVGFQVRSYEAPHIAVRVDARVVFTPGADDSSLVSCRGSCTMERGASAGFMTGFGVAW